MDRLARALIQTTAVVGMIASAAAEQPRWREVTGPPELAFPRDHGAHFEHRTEWWYVTGLLTDERQRRYGFQITFFRQGIEPGQPAPGESRLRARQIVAAHLAIADISEQRFHHAERLRRVAGGLAGASQADLEVWLDDWRMARADDGLIIMTARDPEQGFGLDLELRPERELVRHGDRGYSHKGEENGNAARVEFHDLGLRGSRTRDSAAEIRRKIDQVLTDATYSESVARLQRIVRAYHDDDRWVALLERHAESPDDGAGWETL